MDLINNSAPTLAVVVPCYNEEEVLCETSKRLSTILLSLINDKLIDSNSKIYFVDDGSRDNTWKLIEKESQNSSIRGIKLSRNHGHQKALLAGLMTVTEDIIISIDADLQDDTNAIREMIIKYQEGCEVVYGVRDKRETDTAFKKLTAQGYYKLLEKMGVDLIYNHADYRLLSRKALDTLKEFNEINVFLRGIVPLIGYQSGIVHYERKERFAGESKYPLKKMLAFAAEGITSFSNVPLRIITIFGLCVSVVSFFMIFWVFAVRVFTEEAVPGWASTMIPMFFLSGVQLLSLGIVGEYISKIYMETKRRPKYIIEKII
ncbi:glycosyltransferase family 2 protein [Endozoicomonas sp. SM1973]|uniref:Glycosyltransferase family 2 protein n=1 Tax=Spartinivicinus marinus TaxID=2994442 RepID=A0A853IBC2_9GAMM|nr:glycosyltransferase family 2 protein [Spartinivicinus marinus]MCX4030040.1 glycosyltransferase family 2 protein [Spartinivicinus marinus]NYZ64716.1 glycosyltransferase family 2 protein [Spartinivicinus marinus]